MQHSSCHTWQDNYVGVKIFVKLIFGGLYLKAIKIINIGLGCLPLNSMISVKNKIHNHFKHIFWHNANIAVKGRLY